MSFQGSVYAISNRTLTVYYILMCISLLFMLAGFIILGIWTWRYTEFIVFLSISIIIFMLAALHMAWLFNKKLFALILARWKSTDVHGNIARRKTIDLSINDLNIIDATTKQSLIQTIGVSAFLCSLIISGILILMTIEMNVFESDSVNKDVTETGLIEFLYSLIPSLVILSIILFIAFQPMSDWYDQCCSKCHFWMKGYCVGLVEKEIVEIQKQKNKEKTINRDEKNEMVLKEQHMRTPSNSVSTHDENDS